MSSAVASEVAILVLRVAVALEFFGHGVLALGHKAGWMKYAATLGIPSSWIPAAMTAIGGLDIALAAAVLIRPVRGLVLWMAFWGFFTAALRPLSGEPFIEFVERGANWGAPLALLLLLGWPREVRDLLR